jgi:hypothetical protein
MAAAKFTSAGSSARDVPLKGQIRRNRPSPTEAKRLNPDVDSLAKPQMPAQIVELDCWSPHRLGIASGPKGAAFRRVDWG